MSMRRADHDPVQLLRHVDVVDILPASGEEPLVFEPAQRTPDRTAVHSSMPAGLLSETSDAKPCRPASHELEVNEYTGARFAAELRNCAGLRLLTMPGNAQTHTAILPGRLS